MSIVTMFFDQQKAGEINSIINNNFKNVSKYIPIGFDSLTTVERLNLDEDWRENGKLVFDIDQEKVFIWDEDVVDWVAYLIEAKDSYARALAEETQQKAFSKVTLGDDYILRFQNPLGQEVGNQLLSADKIQYDSTDSVLTKIMALVTEDARQQGEIDTINSKIGDIELPTDAQTLTGAIKELHTELETDTADLTDIKTGAIAVPEALHAAEADHATDSDNLDGKDSSYYAKQSSVTDLETESEQNKTDISNNAINIEALQNDLSALSDKVDENSNSIQDLINQSYTLVEEDFLIEITESKESYESPLMPRYNPDTDILKVFINGGYVYSGNYSITFDSDTSIATITNLNHDTSPWLEGWEICLVTTSLGDTTSTPESGVMNATVGDELTEDDTENTTT